jgi:hypothetical protein
MYTLSGHTGSVQCVQFHPIHPSLLGSTCLSGLVNIYLLPSPSPAISLSAAAAGLPSAAQVLCWGAPPECTLAAPGLLYLGCGPSVWQLRPVAGAVTAASLLATCSDDVSALCLHPSTPTQLAVCDDEGVVTLLGLPSGLPCRVLRKGCHASLATGLAPAGSSAAAPCLLSVGCDQRLMVWEAAAAVPEEGGSSKGGSKGSSKGPLLAESMPDLLLEFECSSSGGSGASSSGGSSGMMVNPPHILSLAAGPGGLYAAAQGDGAVVAVALALAQAQASARTRPSLAVRWVDRTCTSPACAVASVPMGGEEGSEAAQQHVLCAASNCGSLRAWDWAALGSTGSTGSVAPMASWQHGGTSASASAGKGKGKRPKVNWMSGSSHSGGVLAVADTSRAITVYHIRSIAQGGASQ